MSYRPLAAGDGSLLGRVWNWIDDETDPADAADLRTLVDRTSTGDATAGRELADRFATTLGFGTAGLRGPLRAGPNGMNRTVVRRAASGLSRWVVDRYGPGAVVVVGYDARHRSREFAHDSAGVFAAAGLDARLLPGPLPTPVLAFATRHLRAVAGVMVTASHNPAGDNGYKVYAADGAQIIPPADAEIEQAIRSVGAARAIHLARTYRVLGDEVEKNYVDAVARLSRPGPHELRIVHTAMHGVGAATMDRILRSVGFTDIRPVRQQERPDPDFPTVAFPNPEERGALDLALALARDTAADVVIANDPDADRVAIAVPDGGSWRVLTGDETGVLLADELMRQQVRGTYATTIVSSSLLGVMTRARGFASAETLTGFKWITRAAADLVYGYEEALGYAVAPRVVKDKDGMSAGLLVAELAARLKADGASLTGRLDEIAAEFGVFATTQVSFRVADLDRIAATMTRLRVGPPRSLLARTVSVIDRMPEADVLSWRWDGGRVVVRPSGTEPKLKAYLEVAVDSSTGVGVARREAADLLVRLDREVRGLVGL